MKLFDYSITVKAILIGVLIILIGLLVFVTKYSNSRSYDLYRVSQARELANSLERYFDKNNSYPETSSINISSIKIITENGINQTGDYVYFKQGNGVIDATLVSTKERYIIQFNLDNSWEVWNIDSKNGGTCRVSNYLKMICQAND